MARHRSPSGARASDPDRTVQLRIVAAGGTRRMPPPPGATSCARILVAAVAAGAAVAGGETVIAPVEDGLEPVVLGAVLPIPDPHTSPPSEISWDGIGGDQPLPTAVSHADDSPVDVRNLTKAVEIGQELARQAAILDSVLAAGAPGAALFGDSAFAQPVTGRVTSVSGPRWGRTHNGLDVANAIGTPIFAVTDGVVEKSGPASGFGLWVVLRHPDGTRSVYGHINRTYVEVGQQVSAGAQIAEVGNRGFSTGPHLHLEIWDVDGTKLDPTAWLQDRGIDV